MPRVPTLDGPQVRDAASQPVYQNASQFTAGARAVGQLGQALTNTGEAFDQIATREAQRQAYDVESKIRADYLTFEQNARKTRQGANAKGLTDEVDQWWGKAAETYGKDLPPMARQLASKSLANAKLQALAGAGSFENQQLDRALDESWAAAKLTSISTTSANPQPAAIEATVQELRQRNAEQAARRGWTPETLAAEQLKDTSTLHSNVLQGLMQSDPEAARAYFTRYGSEIDGKVHAEITRRIDMAGKADMALKIGAELAGQYSYTNSAEALAAIDKLNQPAEVKQAIRADVLQRHSVQLADAQQRNAKATKEVMAAYAGGATLAQLQKMPQFADLQDGGAAILQHIETRAATQESRLAARESRAAAAESRAESRILRSERAQERATMGAYMRYSDPDVLQSMTRPQIEAMLPVLGADNTNRLLAKKDSFTKSPEKLIEARIDKQDFDHVASQMGLKPFDAKTPAAKERMGELQYRVETLIDRAQTAKKGPLTREEKVELMRGELARTVTTDAGWFSSEKQTPVIALTPDQIKDVIVPPVDRAQIEQALKARGMAVNDMAIRRLYLTKQSRAAELIPDAKR